MSSFFDAHGEKIKGVLSGFDRVRFRGTKRMLANADGLGCFLHFIKVLLMGFKAWSLDLTMSIRGRAEAAREAARSSESLRGQLPYRQGSDRP